MAEKYEFRGNAYRSLTELDHWTALRPEPVLEPELPIIDPHHHVWDSDERGRYLTHELAADVNTGHNILATVFIEAGAMYRADGPEAMKPVGEVEFVNGIAAMSASVGTPTNTPTMIRWVSEAGSSSKSDLGTLRLVAVAMDLPVGEAPAGRYLVRLRNRSLRHRRLRKVHR